MKGSLLHLALWMLRADAIAFYTVVFGAALSWTPSITVAMTLAFWGDGPQSYAAACVGFLLGFILACWLCRAVLGAKRAQDDCDQMAEAL